ncbi:MAG: hypothetical protein IJ628_08350, partial [Bacteroidaceae bacterium]|nr:hypothetical protein [Bacteroidaceae bacterium]
VSSIAGCQQKQYGFFACVYQISKTNKQPSTDSVNEEKKCLVKSGKVIYSVPLQISSFFPCVFPCPLLVFPAPPSFMRIATGKTEKTALRYIIFAPANSQRQEWW